MSSSSVLAPALRSISMFHQARFSLGMLGGHVAHQIGKPVSVLADYAAEIAPEGLLKVDSSSSISNSSVFRGIRSGLVQFVLRIYEKAAKPGRGVKDLAL